MSRDTQIPLINCSPEDHGGKKIYLCHKIQTGCISGVMV
jgi:hypothetical protein